MRQQLGVLAGRVVRVQCPAAGTASCQTTGTDRRAAKPLGAIRGQAWIAVGRRMARLRCRQLSGAARRAADTTTLPDTTDWLQVRESSSPQGSLCWLMPREISRGDRSIPMHFNKDRQFAQFASQEPWALQAERAWTAVGTRMPRRGRIESTRVHHSNPDILLLMPRG
jgi:hypothetical protein